MPENLFERFSPVLSDYRPPVVRDERLLIDNSGELKIYYAPFEYVNPDARVALVGITPGPTQMTNANLEARRALQAQEPAHRVIQLAKDTAAFSGEPMRTNLIKQLNHWGIHTWLGLDDASDLFASARHLVQTTSLLRYPVFVRDQDYRGNPIIFKQALLRKYLLDYFAAEVNELREAVFIGLGPAVQRVLDHLVREGVFGPDRVVGGMLHPSGNNTYRINYLISDRHSPVPHKTNPISYDDGRDAFRRRFLKR
jgi:hypothetical protein